MRIAFTLSLQKKLRTRISCVSAVEESQKADAESVLRVLVSIQDAFGEVSRETFKV
jgi:hypothetical protein